MLSSLDGNLVGDQTSLAVHVGISCIHQISKKISHKGLPHQALKFSVRYLGNIACHYSIDNKRRVFCSM